MALARPKLPLVQEHALLGALGLFAGLVSTVAGLGGGLLALLALSLIYDPARALAMTAPALLIGNVHRCWLFRRSLAHRPVVAFVLGAIPGAIVCGFVAARVPSVVVQVLLVAITAFTLLRALGVFDPRPPRGALTGAGLVVGGLTGVAGGAGVLITPVFLAIGLSGDVLIASSSAAATAIHTARIAGYGASGLIDRSTLDASLVLAAAVLVGNLGGKRLRRLTARFDQRWIEYGMLTLCTTLSVAGLA